MGDMVRGHELRITGGGPRGEVGCDTPPSPAHEDRGPVPEDRD